MTLSGSNRSTDSTAAMNTLESSSIAHVPLSSSPSSISAAAAHVKTEKEDGSYESKQAYVPTSSPASAARVLPAGAVIAPASAASISPSNGNRPNVNIQVPSQTLYPPVANRSASSSFSASSATPATSSTSPAEPDEDEDEDGNDGDEYEYDVGGANYGSDDPFSMSRKKKRRLTEEQITKLAEARDTLGLTGKKIHMSQRLEVAARTGLPESAVRNWLNNHRPHKVQRKHDTPQAAAAIPLNRPGVTVATPVGTVSVGRPVGEYGFHTLPSMNGMHGMDWMPVQVSAPPPSNLTNFFLSQPQQFAPAAAPSMQMMLPYSLSPPNAGYLSNSAVDPFNAAQNGATADSIEMQSNMMLQEQLRRQVHDLNQRQLEQEHINNAQAQMQQQQAAQPGMQVPQTLPNFNSAAAPSAPASSDAPASMDVTESTAALIPQLQAKLAAQQAAHAQHSSMQAAQQAAQQEEIFARIQEIQRYNQVAVEAELTSEQLQQLAEADANTTANTTDGSSNNASMEQVRAQIRSLQAKLTAAFLEKHQEAETTPANATTASATAATANGPQLAANGTQMPFPYSELNPSVPTSLHYHSKPTSSNPPLPTLNVQSQSPPENSLMLGSVNSDTLFDRNMLDSYFQADMEMQQASSFHFSQHTPSVNGSFLNQDTTMEAM